MYEFVRNQPTLFKDLNGLFAFDCDYVRQRISDLQTLSDFGALLPLEDEELMSLKAYYSQNCQDHQPPLPPASTPCPVKLPAPTPNPNQKNWNTTPPVPPIFIIPWYIEWLPVELGRRNLFSVKCLSILN